MSQQADQIRDRRRAFALPGSPLDKAIKILAVGLPALVGAVAAAMLIAPLGPRGEISFLLDRNKVATAEDRLRVDEAMYRGRDDEGRSFSLTAGEAVQKSAEVPIVELRDLTARTTLAATLYQSRHEAGASCAEHAAIVGALEAGDMARARTLMLDHIGHVEEALQTELPTPEPAARLQSTLAPIALPRRVR